MSDRVNLTARATQHFDTTPERVFDAWLDPVVIRQWFAPGLGEMISIDVDARVGGSFSWVQRRDGEDIDHIGVYFELDRPRRLAFTWGVAPEPTSSRVIIEIVEVANGCELTLSHELHADWVDYVDRSAAAWGKMLGEMAQVLAA